MNIVLDLPQFDRDCIHFQEAVHNTVMDNSNFIRILYSNSLFTLNGLFIKFSLRGARTERYFAKYKCSFDPEDNNTTVDQLIAVEREILSRCPITYKKPQERISEQLRGGSIKLFASETQGLIGNCFILKISGVWETATEIGITFKFIDLPRG